LRKAVEDLKAQEENYANSIRTLEQRSQDPAASTVSRNKAAAELSQLKQEDPMPLRKAKITQVKRRKKKNTKYKNKYNCPFLSFSFPLKKCLLFLSLLLGSGFEKSGKGKKGC
jgi:CRISPR/Cas system-associated protein Cas5 (RAMP superfamily)